LLIKSRGGVRELAVERAVVLQRELAVSEARDARKSFPVLAFLDTKPCLA
jgi:hypothetical protein